MKAAFRDTGLDMAESLMAGQIADLLAKHAPDKVQDFLRNPQSILGFKIPAEWATTLGGGVVGMTIAEALGRLFPGIDSGMKNRIRRMAIAVGEELNDVAKRTGGDAGGSNTTDPSTGGRRIVMKNTWLCSSNKPTVVVLNRCSCNHQKGDDTYLPISIDDIVISGKHAPATAAEGYVDGCFCPAVLTAELDSLKAAQAPKTASTPTVKAKAPSFADLVGEVFASGNADRITMVKALLALIESADLSADERRLLEYCDNVNELMALANCKNAKMLRVMLSQLRANAERGLFGQAGEQFQHGLRHVLDLGKKYKDGADARGTEQERRLAVLELCQANDVTREEVLAVIKRDLPDDPVNVNQLTEDHVGYALTVQDGETLSPIEQYWAEQQQKQQRQQPAKKESRWSRLKKHFSDHLRLWR